MTGGHCLRFDQPAAQEAFDALVGAVQTRDVQLRRLDTKIDDWSTREPLREPVAGNQHIRRVLVEATWSHRHRRAIGDQLRRRQQEQPQAVLTHSSSSRRGHL